MAVWTGLWAANMGESDPEGKPGAKIITGASEARKNPFIALLVQINPVASLEVLWATGRPQTMEFLNDF